LLAVEKTDKNVKNPPLEGFSFLVKKKKSSIFFVFSIFTYFCLPKKSAGAFLCMIGKFFSRSITKEKVEGWH